MGAGRPRYVWVWGMDLVALENLFMQSGDELWVVSASGGLCPGVELTGTGHSAGTGQIFAGVLSTLPLPCLPPGRW